MTDDPERTRSAVSPSRSSPTRRQAPRPSRTPPPGSSTTTPRPSASSPTTRTSPSRSSPTRGTTCRQGWLYGFSDGRGGYPLDWTALKAWGSDRPEPERYPGSGGKGYDWPALGWHEFRDPNEEWELTLYRYNANVVRQLNQNIDVARQTKAFEQWNRNWVRFVESHVGAWMHVDHGLGLYLFANANRRAPTNMHNNAISVNSMHRIRSAQDLALYNLTLTEEIDGFDGTAHLTDVEQRPGLAGRPRGGRAADRDRRLVRGHLRRQRRVRAAGRRAVPQPPGACRRRRATATSSPRPSSAPRSTTSPSGTCATRSRCSTCSPTTASSPTTTRACCRTGCPPGPAGRIAAARTLQPLWSLPDAKPPRFEDGLDAAKNRFAGILTDLNLDAPKELAQ